MLNDGPIIGFIPTTDAARARQFYVELLGLEFEEDNPFALVVRSGASMIRIVKMQEHIPVGYTILGWETPEIEKLVARLIKAGVSFQRYPFMEKSGPPIWTAPNRDKIAWFHDPDGNTLSLSQHVRP